eukprot:1422475-Rhodomonas_salina.2
MRGADTRGHAANRLALSSKVASRINPFAKRCCLTEGSCCGNAISGRDIASVPRSRESSDKLDSSSSAAFSKSGYVPCNVLHGPSFATHSPDLAKELSAYRELCDVRYSNGVSSCDQME